MEDRTGAMLYRLSYEASLAGVHAIKDCKIRLARRSSSVFHGFSLHATQSSPCTHANIKSSKKKKEKTQKQNLVVLALRKLVPKISRASRAVSVTNHVPAEFRCKEFGPNCVSVPVLSLITAENY